MGMLGEDDTVDRLERAGREPLGVEPLDDHVLVQLATEEHETPSGVIIPASGEVQVGTGIVLAVGDDVTGIGPGDKVVFPRAAAIEVRVGGASATLVRRGDLIARFSE